MRILRAILFNSGNHPSLSTNIALLAGRLSFGLMLAFLHGMGKTPPAAGFIEGVGAMGFPAPALFAWAASLSELFGGILIAMGLLTRPAALAVGFTMCVAIFIRHAPDPIKDRELALVYLTFAVIIFLCGAGRFSVDWLLSRRRS